jgi:cyanophycinase-like exopeptidase
MPATSRLHREAMAALAGQVRAVFVDTTAGFESNVDAITAKAVEYYRQRLQTDLQVASFRHSGRADDAETARAVAAIRAANFIFAGPGSPTYALTHWRDSPVWQAIRDAWLRGASLLFASAAAITLGKYALPVYEIFKAGHDPYWVEGLDLLGELGLTIAIVPHFNDNSGGENYDSRFCYMGAARFDILQAQLPENVAILGIDEYTAVRIDPRARLARIIGQGAATVIANGTRREYPAGSVISFDDLRSSHRAVVPTYRPGEATLGYAFADPSANESEFDTLAEFASGLPALSTDERVELLARIEAAARAARQADPDRETALVNLVLELRAALRAAAQWELADKARDMLTALGYEIQDTKDGSTWRRM